jgi:hypothetical protein
MEISARAPLLVSVAIALAACDAPGLGGAPTVAERACTGAVAEAAGGAAVTVIAHVPYTQGAITNVEVPSLDTRFICRTNAEGAVLEVLEV